MSVADFGKPRVKGKASQCLPRFRWRIDVRNHLGYPHLLSDLVRDGYKMSWRLVQSSQTRYPNEMRRGNPTLLIRVPRFGLESLRILQLSAYMTL